MSLANKAPKLSDPPARLGGIERKLSRKDKLNDKQ